MEQEIQRRYHPDGSNYDTPCHSRRLPVTSGLIERGAETRIIEQYFSGRSFSFDHLLRTHVKAVAGGPDLKCKVKTVLRGDVCRPLCSCRCHEQIQFSTSSSWRRSLGRMIIRFSGLPMTGSNPCTNQDCRRNYPQIHVTYCFPVWLILRQLHLFSIWRAMQGPSATLKLPRMVQGSALIF